MPIAGLVTGLSQAARQALPLIRSGVRQKVGADTLFRRLRGTFPGLLRREVRLIAGAERNIIASRADLRFVNRANRPNPFRLPPALTALRRQFSFRVRVRGIDITTGDLTEQFVTVTTDELLTRGDIEDVAEEFVVGERKRYGTDVTEVLIFEGVKAGPAGVL